MKCNRPGLGVSFGVINREVHVQMSHIVPLGAFGNMKGFRCGMTGRIEPSLSIKTGRIDD